MKKAVLSCLMALLVLTGARLVYGQDTCSGACDGTCAVYQNGVIVYGTCCLQAGLVGGAGYYLCFCVPNS